MRVVCAEYRFSIFFQSLKKTNSSNITDKIGYVSNSPPNIQKMCFENINEKLKVINIKDNPRGVRVMFQSLYNEDVEVDGVFGD